MVKCFSMRQIATVILVIGILITSFGCEQEPTFGHLEVTITYPEAVYEDGIISFIPVPGEGAEVRLYDEDAKCLGIRDARIDVAWIGDDAVFSKYAIKTNEKGVAFFSEIPVGGYYLVVFSRQLNKYTEKYIEVGGGDTLILAKYFTEDIGYYKQLEPWDYEMPPY